MRVPESMSMRLVRDALEFHGAFRREEDLLRQEEAGAGREEAEEDAG